MWLAILITAASCGERACDVCMTTAVVYGTVTGASGQPVAGAPVDVRAYLNDCVASQLRGATTGQVAFTNVQGRYRTNAMSLFSPFTANCFVVTLNKSADARWPTDSAQIRTQLEFRFGGRQDSARFDLVVRM